MSFGRFIDIYPRYKSFVNNQTVKEIYEFLSEAESIDKMINACTNGKPALNGVVIELENKFDAHNDFDIKLDFNKQLVGSLVCEVLMDFGYEKNIQRTISGARYFKSAMHYTLNPALVKKVLVRKLVIQEV